MRHRKARNNLGRDASHRTAMMRNMTTSLFKHEQLVTTDAKARQLKSVAEKMVTLAKRGDLHARRQALSYIRDGAITHKLFEELKDRYQDRQGGYIRVLKKGHRKGDGAAVSVIQLLPAEETKKRGKGKAKAAGSEGKRSKKERESRVEKDQASSRAARDSDQKAGKPSTARLAKDKKGGAE
jgi:large subunit ribosomal protein L17